MKFQDIELEYKGETYTIKKNKVFKLYRDVSPMVTMQNMANVENIILDSPFIFSDAYCKTLAHAGQIVDGDDVLEWMCDNNYDKVLLVLGVIKTLFQQPEKIQKKTGKQAKKKVTTRKK